MKNKEEEILLCSFCNNEGFIKKKVKLKELILCFNCYNALRASENKISYGIS